MSTSAMSSVKPVARYSAMGALYAIVVAIPMIVAAKAVDGYFNVGGGPAPSGSCSTVTQQSNTLVVDDAPSGLSASGALAGSSTGHPVGSMPPVDSSTQVPVGTIHSAGG